ncbi:hypothetical protein PR048_016735 [Dryococelus australis]|uniref:MADF domain-containing protein n=1 Tax=Dryococelus australis TaxID=614101 RepID=A0ABQ9H7I9_9NEOP|nr:hypothetical protein PR048_016735 [Dryococelus australis]
MYRDSPCLWDPQHPEFKMNAVENYAWTTASVAVGCTAVEARKKIESLMASFRRERQNSQMRKSGAGAEESYNSKWFAYKSLLFLMDKYKVRGTDDTVNVSRLIHILQLSS